jgi:CelD/BcsL family acetyltransferase involved in cellulose biosynthesis
MQVRLISVYEDFFSLREDWNGLLESYGGRSVFLTHQWFDSWWRGFGGHFRLNILRVQKEGRTIGYAPLMRRGNSLLFIASDEVTDYCDFIYDEEEAEPFFSTLLETLIEDSSVEELSLINLSGGSPTPGTLKKEAERMGLVFQSRSEEATLVLELPRSYQDYLSGLQRKDRHELKRKHRRAAGLSESRLVSTDRDIPQEEMEEFIRLHRDSDESKRFFWKKEGMETFFKSLFAGLSRQGWARIDSLYSGGVLVASLLSFEYGEETSLYNIAFNKDFASFSPGYTLFAQAIGRAIQNDKHRVDFLRGRERYKYEFGAVDREIVRISLRLRG